MTPVSVYAAGSATAGSVAAESATAGSVAAGSATAESVAAEVTTAEVSAVPKQAKLLIGGANKQANAYIIGGHTYFKLRDMAELFADTSECFDVGWNERTHAVALTSGKRYAHHSESGHHGNAPREAVPSTNSVALDGQSIRASAYLIDGANYFKFTDLAQALDVPFRYDQPTDTIHISLYTAKDYGYGKISAFQTTDTKGNSVDESIFREKAVTFINYWATWCPPCRAELPEFQSLYDEYKDQVTFLTIVDDGADNPTADKMVKDYLTSFTNLLPDDALLQAVASGYVPTSVIVNGDGYLMLEQIIGSNSMEGYAQYLDQALKLAKA
jgi:thiol-disulfide isomerase/thioredoxin